MQIAYETAGKQSGASRLAAACLDSGIPIKRGGEIVGAIGVSGGSGEQDQAITEAGAAAVG